MQTYDDIKGSLFHENFEEYIMLGMFFSKAVISLFQDKIIDVFYLYSYDNFTKIVSPPYARIAIDSTENTLAFYYKTDKKPFASTLPENFVSKIPYDETFIKWTAVYEQWYCKIREFAFQENLGDEQKTILKEFLQAFDYIIDKELQPFYFELSPEFWEWLVKYAG